MPRSIAIIKRRGVPLGVTDPALDGGTVNLLESVAAIHSADLRVHIFTSSDVPPQQHVQLEGKTTIHRLFVPPHVTSNGLSRDFAEGSEFAQRLVAYPPFRNLPFDLIHSHHWSSCLPA